MNVRTLPSILVTFPKSCEKLTVLLLTSQPLSGSVQAPSNFFNCQFPSSFLLYYNYIYMLLPKKQKNEKKKKSQSRQLEWWERKKIIKKNVTSCQPVTDWHVSGRGSFPPFETAGMRKTTKIKTPKMKVGHFGNFFSKRVKLEIFLVIRSEKKNP